MQSNNIFSLLIIAEKCGESKLGGQVLEKKSRPFQVRIYFKNSLHVDVLPN